MCPKDIFCHVLCLHFSGCIPSPLNCISVSPTCIFSSHLSPTYCGYTERPGEICLRRHEMLFPLKRHIKQPLFLITAATDHSWIGCQSTSTAAATFDGSCVCTCANADKGSQLSLTDRQCFLCCLLYYILNYLFDKHLQMDKKLHS